MTVMKMLNFTISLALGYCSPYCDNTAPTIGQFVSVDLSLQTENTWQKMLVNHSGTSRSLASASMSVMESSFDKSA